MSKGFPVRARRWLFATIAAAGCIGVVLTMAAIPAPDLTVAGNRREVPFDRDIRACAVVATIKGDGQTVSITMTDEDGAGIHTQSFHLAVLC